MSSYKKYFDPAQVESDQKDLVISQLKAELFELRQNSRDYDDLRTKLNNLEHRYSLLQEEKVLNEREFKTRNDMAGKTVGNLKIEIDSLKQELNILNADIDDLRSENLSINDIINGRSAEIARLKAEITDVYDSNNDMALENKDLDMQLNRTRAENRDVTHRIDDASQNNAELNERRIKYERIIRELEIERDRNERTHDGLLKNADSLRNEIRNKTEAIKYSENSLAECRKSIIELEADLNDMRRINEKIRNDIISHQKNQQVEFNKNVDLNAQVNRLEALIGQRENEIGDLRREYEELKRDHLKLIDTNDDLHHDIEACSRHLDLLTAQNHELVIELEKYNEQDERVRGMLDRKDRVHEVKSKTEGRMKQSFYAMSSSIRSPGKRRPEFD